MSRPRSIIHLPIICGIYKITAPNKKIYIGQSNDIYFRFYGYEKRGCKKQWKLHKSLIHYGHENHKFEIIRICKESQLNFWEKYYEKMNGSWNTPWALNCKEGGYSHGKWSDESRKKISNSKKNRPFTEQHRKNISKSKLGKEAWNKGLKGCYSENAIQNMSNGQKNRLPLPQEHRKNISEGGKKSWENKKEERKKKCAKTRSENKERRIKEGYVKVKKKYKKPRTAEHSAKIIVIRKANAEFIRQERAMMIF